MSGGLLKIICVIFFYLFILLSFVSSDLGFGIYNGMYWSEIRHIFSEVSTQNCKLSMLPMLTMITWILSICLPAFGPLIPAILIVLWTSPQQCEQSKAQFITEANTNTTELSSIWSEFMVQNGMKSADWSDSLWFDTWFYNHCNKPSLINFIFVCITIFAILVMALRAMYKKCCARRRSYQQF